MRATCSPLHHIWPITAVDGKLKTTAIGHGHRCLCGKFVAAYIDCDQGGRHKRVVPLAEFERLMEATR